MDTLARTLKTLGDPTRLRLLRLLAAEPLNVGEMTSILGIAQPSVSRQLGALKRAGLVQEERNGGYAFYSLDPAAGNVWLSVAAEVKRQPDVPGDLARLAEVVRRRTERGGASSRLLEPGRSWPAWSRALGWLIPPLRVADLGCGDGALTMEIARWAREVVAVDHDAALLGRARARVKNAGFTHVRCRRQRLEKLTLADASFDLAVLSQALHYFDDPDRPLRQAARILVPGGRLLLLDLAPHGEDWVRDKLEHVHMGFRGDDLAARLAAAGFEKIESDEMRKGPGQPFRILIVTGVRTTSGETSTKDHDGPGGKRRRRPSSRKGGRP